MKKTSSLLCALVVMLFINLCYTGIFDISEAANDISKNALNKIQKVMIQSFLKEAPILLESYTGGAKYDVRVKDYKITRIKKDGFLGEFLYPTQMEITQERTLLNDFRFKNGISLRKGHTESQRTWYRCKVIENSYGDFVILEKCQNFSKNPSE